MRDVSQFCVCFLSGDTSLLDSRLHGKLSLEGFDLNKVLDNGAPLLASIGQEFEINWGEMDPKERLLLQKKQLKQRLGMGSEFGTEGRLFDTL